MQHDEDRVVEEIYDALDRQDPEAALTLARETLAREGEDPVLHFLAGMALMELDVPHDAAEAFGRAVALDSDDAEFRVNLAMALYKACRFDEARAHARQALDTDPASADAHFVHALLLERQGKLDEADRDFAEATRIDPDTFPPPHRLPRERFEAEARRAAELLPPDFRRHLDAISVTVDALPSDDVLTEQEPPLDPELLGLFVGTALTERSFTGPGGEMPPRILLFQRNLERYAGSTDEIVEEIRRTLYHELAHYLGFDEDEMAGMDLA